MTLETALGLSGLYLASFWTPGPNNAMLAASGAKFGLLRTLPHIFGVVLGFTFMMVVVALGLGNIFKTFPILLEILRWVGAVALLYVAYKIALSGAPGSKSGRQEPFRFYQAVMFQWINPKAWIMTISISTLYIQPDAVLFSTAMLALFSLLGITSAFAWTGLGSAMQKWLTSPLRYHGFNAIMAGTIVLGVYYLLTHSLEISTP